MTVNEMDWPTVAILEDELQDAVTPFVAIDPDYDVIHIDQGGDRICIPVELWERFATSVMGAVMNYRREREAQP